MSASPISLILCRRCTADAQLDARDPARPGYICACGWDSRRDADDDLAVYRTGPDAPSTTRAIGAESVPVLMGEIRRMREALRKIAAGNMGRTWCAERARRAMRDDP